MTLSLVKSVSEESTQSLQNDSELLNVTPFAAMRCAQATVLLDKLELEYDPKIAALDVELAAALLTLAPQARRLQEATEQANACALGEDHPPFGTWSVRAVFFCLFFFELILGYLAMTALTA